MDVTTRKLYRDWVMSGGHLVILGGSLSFGQGAMAGTFLDDVLPCKLQSADIAKLPDRSTLSSKGRIYYAHTVQPKPNATVMVSSGKLPMAMSHTIQKGTCSVFAGTVLGAKADAPNAFWNTPEWKNILAKLLKK